jgi:tetratricopeptide (TPR) repeat protein
MNLQAEVVWRMAGLSLPAPVASPALPLRELTKYSGVALFIERATRAQPDFQLTAENGPTIVAICRLVEGLPLAIELAAALTKQYTCTALYTALQQDYMLLATAGADGNARHHSIQAMLAYSWRLLTAAEARLLASCAIFVGGFTRAAVLAITDVAPALLVNLIDQSLLQMRAGRFFMHAFVRHYAAAQLAQVPQWQVYMAAAHAAYYIDLLHSLEGALVIDSEAQQRIQNEIENIRTAWAWSVAQAEVALLDKGVGSLQSFYHLTGLYREGLHLLTTALDMVKRTSVTGPTAVRVQSLQVRLLCYSAQFYRRLGELQRCEQCASDALALANGLADPALQGLAYHELARLAYVRGDFLLMNEMAEQGYKQARQSTLRHLTAECLNDLGLAVGMCQGPLAAVTYFHEALDLLQGGDNRFLQAFIFVNLGFFYLSCHQYQWACDHLQQGITIQQQFQIRGGSMMPLRYLGDLWLALGRYAAAQQQYEQALALSATMYSHYAVSGLYSSYGRLQHLRGDPKAAITTCTSAYQLAQQGGVMVQEQWARVFLGHALLAVGDTAAAEHHYRQALALHKAGNWVYRTADAHAGLAALLLATNQVASAVVHIEAALDLLAQHGLAGANEPFTLYWTAVRVFTAAKDVRATTVLHTAYQHLQTIAAQLTDERLRHAFLQEVTVNHHLLTTAQSAEIG